MARQSKDHSGKPRKVPATRVSEDLPANQSTGAPLIIAIILIAAIAVGLGYSVFRRNHEPNAIGVPASTSMESAPAPDGPAGSAAPADSASPQPHNTYGATLIN